jgi:Fe-S-cluster-containing hydrogenase component 2
MPSLDQHPTVLYHRAHAGGRPPAPATLDAGWLRQLCLDAGADDVGFVEVGRAELAGEREHILAAFPRTRTLVSLACRMNREPIRSPARSVANLEFHHSGDQVTDAARRIVAELERIGVRAMNPSVGFPMEADRFPDARMWVVAHKPVAVAAGLGRLGIHRNVIHPRFGSFVLLGTVLIDAEVSASTQPVDYNPCLECKLCVAACPTGAIGTDGRFDFAACYTHNYREFMGGFSDWVETVVESGSAAEYRSRVTAGETVSMWQSLSFGANYKAAYCIAVCPAGEDVIGPFLADRKEFLQEVVRPLQEKVETVYVVHGSDAERRVPKRFPRKTVKRVKNGLRPATVRGFLRGLPFAFQPEQAGDLAATYHFEFTGEEAAAATVVIRDRTIQVRSGLDGTADLTVRADGRTWIRFLAKERGLLGALLRRTIRLRGDPRLLLAFGRCFPS